MNLVIRRMALEDIPPVHAIDVLSFSLPWPENSYHFELTRNPVSRCWVAENGGQLVAMLVLWLILDEAHVATIATHPNYRRLGIGQQLMNNALLSARAEGAKRAFLEVRAGNAGAIALYEKYGFVVAGVRKRYYKDNNEDAILMNMEDLDQLEAG